MATVRFGPFKMDLDTEELWKDGAKVPLAPKASQGLALLVRRAGSLVRRSDLHEELWSTTVVELDQGLNSVIRQIRTALGDDASAPIYLETVPRKGYRFVGEVTAPVETSEGSVPAPRNAPGSSLGSRNIWAAVAAGLVIVAGVLSMTSRAGQGVQGTPGTSSISTPSLPAEYLRWTAAARHLLEQETRVDATRALAILDTLVARYPDRSAPRADRADALLRLGQHAAAREEMNRALRADSASARAWAVNGTLLLRDWRLSDALGAFQRAIVLQPSEASHHHSLGYALALIGDHEGSQSAMERALELTPLSPAVHGDAGLFERWAGRLDDAESRCVEALRLVEARWLVRPHRCLLQVAAGMGNLAEARAQARQMLMLAGLSNPEITEIMDATVGMDGYWAWARRTENLSHAQGFVGPYAAALGAADAGDLEAAFTALREALNTRQPALIQVGVETRFAGLRGDPRFDAIRRAVLGSLSPTTQLASR